MRTPGGHSVTFESDSTCARGGLLYTNGPSTSFDYLCVRLVVGSWWMFASATDANGDPGSCDFGYRFVGGREGGATDGGQEAATVRTSL